ncbi:MAG: Mrp/NBP35 family ATP-binding protein [Clostridia bacterium]|nr:Mrp/NBP35 family ATP-binding protein [Clostridia bacterium]
MANEECTHDCSTCSLDCDSKNIDFREKLNEYSSVKKRIAIVSGKGGVGKSFVTSMLASETARRNKKVAILDADITGPSIPKMFGLNGKVVTTEKGWQPVTTKNNIDVISINLMLEDESMPVIWRGPVIAGTVRQFYGEVHWDNIDYMFIDMPPGTGDVPLTVFQSLQLDGIIIVTSPQDLVSMIVSKALNMAKEMDIPVLGIVENYSYLTCPDCNKKISVFGESNIEKVADDFEVELLGKLPINPDYAKQCDEGKVYDIELGEIKNIVDKIIK